MLETFSVGDKVEMLVTDSLKNPFHNEKANQHNDAATNILKMSTTSSHQNIVVINISFTKKSLFVNFL